MKKKLRLISWNVNGIRAAAKRGFLEWFSGESPDILCLQETKANPDQLDESLTSPPGYRVYWNHGERKGYAGVATFVKETPQSVWYDFGPRDFDLEGRVIITEYPAFTLINIYFPNGKKNQERLDYKMKFYDIFLDYADGLRKQGRKLIVCGDYNTAHREIDIARPKENAKVSGFLPEERAWLDKYAAHGYVDVFRKFHPETVRYTYWDVKTRARERNVGWRIDYFFVSEDLTDAVEDAFIMTGVPGSDHCPLGITLKTD
jgi:exodeoxyribonuclease III